MDENRLAILEAQEKKIRKELGEIRDAERLAENKKFLGKFFRYRNCYSCPSKSSDYWWMYMSVTGCDIYGNLKTWSFQTDQYGKVEVEFKETLVSVFDGYQPITAREFWAAWRSLMKRLSAIEEKAGNP